MIRAWRNKSVDSSWLKGPVAVASSRPLQAKMHPKKLPEDYSDSFSSVLLARLQACRPGSGTTCQIKEAFMESVGISLQNQILPHLTIKGLMPFCLLVPSFPITVLSISMAASDDTYPHSDTSSTLHGHDYNIALPAPAFSLSADTHRRDKEENGGSQLFSGLGTAQTPFIVDWYPNDKENPYNWSKPRKWLITAQLALSTWTVSFGSSSYSGSIHGTMTELKISESVAILGISLYVLGFALGPLIFAPMGEMCGRRSVFLITLSVYMLFQLGGSLGRNLPSLLTCRLLTGIFGSSPLTNAGGAISDIWNVRERGLASAIYATVPFLGPVIGPIVGGFVAENPRLGWRFNFWLIFIFSGFVIAFGYVVTPETYAPVLLRKRAQQLTAASNGALCYISKHDVGQCRPFRKIMLTNLGRPFAFIITEPIVLLLAVYISIMYGTLYALFAAFPIVFGQHRGFTPGQTGLAFTGVGFGIILGVAMQSLQDKLFLREIDRSSTGSAPPEARLHMSMVGGALVPVGLFWFSWTTFSRIHWIVPVLAGIPFGAGVAQILQSLTTYLMDTYPLYFASAIASTIVLRSICAAAFPLFSPSLFDSLGDHWSMSIFAFLSVACMPIPIFFWRYGAWIRSKSRVARQN